MTGTARIVRGNALDLPLADGTVDLIVTSPPYFGLRSYQDGGEHYAGQLGSEATPAEFVDALLTATREMVRVLKPSGSIWVNLGDKYNSGGGASVRATAGREGHRGTKWLTDPQGQRQSTSAVPTKSLIGIPWRYAIRCIDELGLILRAEIIWSKPNGLPESVTDRVRRSHEVWFHFTKEPRYFAAVDEIREEHAPQSIARTGRNRFAPDLSQTGVGSPNTLAPADMCNPLGKLPGSVWTVNDSGPSLVRSVLAAVAADAITPEEGERILWSPSNRSWHESQWSTPAAGNGSSTATRAATPRSASAVAARSSLTGSPTSCTSDPSQTDSPSTTSAATRHASDQTTSRPSPSERTSDEQTPSEQSADTGTPWPTLTSTSPLPGSITRSAARASSPASDAGESVWVVPTQPLKVPAELGIDHFAAFPMEHPRRIIRGWSPSGVCTGCGEGRRPVVDKTLRIDHDMPGYRDYKRAANISLGGMTPKIVGSTEATITGYACACPEPTAPTTPATILDPFGGTGTTALVARALGRHGISVDMSADYCRLAQWRTNDEGELALALEVDKPAPQVEGQESLFDLLEGEPA